MYQYQYPKADVTASVMAYMMESQGHPTVTTLSVLGVIRGKEPFKGKTAFPGGFLDVNVETLRHCGFRETFLEEIVWRQGEKVVGNLRDVYGHFGLRLPYENALSLLCEQSLPARDPRVQETGAPVIDHVYTVELPWEVFTFAGLDGGDDAHGIVRKHYVKDKLPTRQQIRDQWAFDHGESIILFLERLLWLQPELTDVKCPACSGTGKISNV